MIFDPNSRVLIFRITESPRRNRRAALFLETSGADGLLGRPELAELLCRDVQAEAAEAAAEAPAERRVASGPSGPSAFVAHEASSVPKKWKIGLEIIETCGASYEWDISALSMAEKDEAKKWSWKNDERIETY